MRVKVRVIFMVLGTHKRCPESLVNIRHAAGSGQVFSAKVKVKVKVMVKVKVKVKVMVVVLGTH